MKRKYKSFIKVMLFVIGFTAVMYVYDYWGVIGAIIFLFVWLVYRLWTRRKLLMVFLRDTETRIFGRPLEKEYWGKGEMKNTKFKLVWGRKNGKRNKEKKLG